MRDNKAQANAAVKEWVCHNREEYERFKQQVTAIGEGDMTLPERMMTLFSDCMPQSARDFYGYIFHFLMHPEEATDDGVAFTPYDQLAAQCINGKALIKMDLEHGTIARTETPSNHLVIIRTDDFEKSIQQMPYSMKCVINQGITLLMMSNGYFASSDSTAALRDLAMTVAKTLYVYSLLFVPEYLQQLYQKIVNEQEPLAYCVYYYVTFDHGLKEMSKAFSWRMNGNDGNPMTCELLKLCLRMFVRHSLENETETKADWLRLADKLGCEEAWKEIHFIAEQVKTHGGKHTDQRIIDELLIGDIEQLKSFIAHFLQENNSPCHLAYLLYALREKETIDNCDYITFHRAIQPLGSKPIGGPDVPQRRYNELLACPKLLNESTDKWKRANAIVNQLTEGLGKMSESAKIAQKI